MNNRLSIFAIFLFGVMLTCEKKSIDLVEPQPEPSPDTLIYHITSGSFIRLDSLKDVYDLDTEVKGFLSLTNVSDSIPIVIDIGNWPPTYWLHILDQDSKPVWLEPGDLGYAVFTDTVLIGETFRASFGWSQLSSSLLKVYSGQYAIEPGIRGTRYHFLKKQIVISEIGDPLSARLAYDYTVPDTVRFSFVVRNRVTAQKLLTASIPKPVQVEFTKNGLTALVFQDSLAQFTLPGHSDVKVYKYQEPKNSTFFSGFNGSYYLKVTVSCDSLIFTQGVPTYF